MTRNLQLLILTGMGFAVSSNNILATKRTDKKLPNVIYIFPDQMRNSAMEFWE